MHRLIRTAVDARTNDVQPVKGTTGVRVGVNLSTRYGRIVGSICVGGVGSITSAAVGTG